MSLGFVWTDISSFMLIPVCRVSSGASSAQVMDQAAGSLNNLESIYRQHAIRPWHKLRAQWPLSFCPPPHLSPTWLWLSRSGWACGYTATRAGNSQCCIVLLNLNLNQVTRANMNVFTDPPTDQLFIQIYVVKFVIRI